MQEQELQLEMIHVMLVVVAGGYEAQQYYVFDEMDMWFSSQMAK